MSDAEPGGFGQWREHGQLGRHARVGGAFATVRYTSILRTRGDDPGYSEKTMCDVP